MKLATLALLAIAANSQTLSLAPSAWTLTYEGPTAIQLTASGGGLAFAFPVFDGVTTASANYLTTRVQTPRSAAPMISADVQVFTATGAEQFINYFPYDPDCQAASTVRLYFEVKGMKYNSPSDRWWANPPTGAYMGAFTLTGAGGIATLSVPLIPSEWSNAQGQWGSSVPSQFAAAVKSIARVGVTFGGCFFGHGVGVSNGTATFKITRFEVQ